LMERPGIARHDGRCAPGDPAWLASIQTL